MRHHWLLSWVLIALLIAAGPLWPRLTEAQGLPDATQRQAIQNVIAGQIEAFQRDDGSAAFSYASPTIQGIFQTPENFMTMVKSGYQPVYRPKSVTFRELELNELGLDQQVLVVGPDGIPYVAHYTMQLQPDGSWRINGCFLTKLPEESV